ncbi:MAG: hypothetical protein GY754_09035 [bacterium]|nr:hypothetical protein [bacterium]
MKDDEKLLCNPKFYRVFQISGLLALGATFLALFGNEINFKLIAPVSVAILGITFYFLYKSLAVVTFENDQFLLKLRALAASRVILYSNIESINYDSEKTILVTEKNNKNNQPTIKIPSLLLTDTDRDYFIAEIKKRANC